MTLFWPSADGRTAGSHKRTFAFAPETPSEQLFVGEMLRAS
jgi:hypothetical protein